MTRSEFSQAAKVAIVAAIIAACFASCTSDASAQVVSKDTAVRVYANFTDSMNLIVPKNYVNAMAFKYGMNWKEIITSRLTKVAQDAMKEYDEAQRQYIMDNLDTVSDMAGLNSIRQKSLGYVKTIPKSAIDSLTANGYIIASE